MSLADDAGQRQPFPGFYPPEYTMVPNDLFGLMPSLSGAELKVLLYVMRQTFGWHRDAAAISLTALQGGTGLTRKTLAAAVRSLESLDCMIAQRSMGADGAAAVTVYRLKVIEREGRGITPPRQRNYSSGGSGTIPHLPIEKRNPDKENVSTQVEETAAALWSAALDQLRGDMSTSNFETWFAGSTGLRLDNGALVVQASAGQVEALETRFAPLVKRALDGRAVRFVRG